MNQNPGCKLWPGRLDRDGFGESLAALTAIAKEMES